MYLTKLVVIGKNRKAIYSFMRCTIQNDMIADFSSVLPDFPTSRVIKAEEHHAKTHIHMLSGTEFDPKELMSALLKAFTDLRFTLYYESPEGYRTLHGRNGKLDSDAYRQINKEVPQNET